MIWFSRGEEKGLKLAEVSRIVPGQRTVILLNLLLKSKSYFNLFLITCHEQAVFKRFLRPEKDHLSFSLLYNNRERSLDLVSK